MTRSGRFLVTTLLVFSPLMGCGPGHDPAKPPTGGTLLPPLELGRWYLHEVDGSPVPGVVLEPPTGAGPERTQVDSAYFEVLPGDALEYRSWMIRTGADGSVNSVARLSTGTWGATSEVYMLRIGGGGETITLSPTPEGALEGDQQLPVNLGGTTMQVVFHPEPPPGG